MPTGLHRHYGAGHLHFITTSCYRRLPLLNKPRQRDFLLAVLEQVRRRYRLLLGEPERGNPSKVMQAIKQGFARRLLARLRSASNPCQESLWQTALDQGHIWQARFYDFVVFSEHKRVEKLRYMHDNPVKRGLVLE